MQQRGNIEGVQRLRALTVCSSRGMVVAGPPQTGQVI